MSHPVTRPRRLRQSELFRELVRETQLSRSDLVLPLFIRPGQRVRAPIPTLPGHFQLSVDQAAEECAELVGLGLRSVLLFGMTQKKDERGSQAWARDGIIQQAVAAIKAKVGGQLLVMTDVCLCAYTSHGHCGVLAAQPHPRKGKRAGRGAAGAQPAGSPRIDNDASVELLAKTAVSHAESGADVVAPSDMMDGTVGAVRKALDQAGRQQTPIMAYAVKYASSFYGPFREAVGSTPAFGDRRSYQMDPANAEEALREARLDLEQGADIIMIKPALAYLDIVRQVKDRFGCPVAAFNVSGEYAMVKAAAARGWLVERAAWHESLVCLKRAGADVLITYWAKDAAKALTA